MTLKYDRSSPSTMPTLLAAALLLLSSLLGACASKKPPTEELTTSRAALQTAADAGAIDLAPAEMQAAEDKADRARSAAVAGDFNGAQRLAEESQADAELAAIKAQTARTRKVTQLVQDTTRQLQDDTGRKAGTR
jgi:hypothetical protein